MHSMDLNLFFMRIMKEHLIFIKASLPAKYVEIIKDLDIIKNEASIFLGDVISFSNGLVSNEAINSEEFVTKYTLAAERKTEYYTGIHIDGKLTVAEHSLVPAPTKIVTQMMVQNTILTNKRAIDLVMTIIAFKENLQDDVLNCRVYTSNYPDLLHHVILEAKFYLAMLMKIQKRDIVDTGSELLEYEIFWNHIMGDHAKFIRGGLDPSEKQLFEIANMISNEFEQLDAQAENVKAHVGSLSELTRKGIEETLEIREFNIKGLEGILACKVKSTILPLLADHTLREANHYLRILNMYKDINSI